MRPFLLLSIRADDVAADDEYEAFLRFSGLPEAMLQRVRCERSPLGDPDPADWAGVILGGGPFNVSDPEAAKSAVQRRVEADLARLLDRIVALDSPFLGACYGIGTLGTHQGAVVDRRYAEPISAVTVTLTDEGRSDPVFGRLPQVFDAFVGHKEAISALPAHAALLASSRTCPVQAFRVGRNVYATQFHPELDVGGLHTRIEVYKDAGYFHPAEAEGLKARVGQCEVVHPPEALTGFVERYRDDAPRRGGAAVPGTAGVTPAR